VQLDIKRFDKELGILEAERQNARQALLEAPIPSELASNPYFAVEAVMNPHTQVPTSDPFKRRLSIGVVIGLMLGVVAAFALDYLLQIRRSGSQPRPSA
jgi:hypothetical protein